MSCVAFAYAPPTASSLHTAKLHEAITHTFPDYAHAKALTDNGSEFKGHFAKRMSDNDVVHWKTYPKTPKMNAHCERFNRSIQESFVDYHEDLFFTDLALFNQKMSDWLVFYNTELPHLSTKPNPKKSASLTNLPISPVEFLFKLHPHSRMYWTNTTMKVSIGLEFPVVALPGVGHMPAEGEDQQEAVRVFYLAATRATRATQRLVLEMGGDGGWQAVSAVNRLQITTIDLDVLNGYQFTMGKINE